MSICYPILSYPLSYLIRYPILSHPYRDRVANLELENKALKADHATTIMKTIAAHKDELGTLQTTHALQVAAAKVDATTAHQSREVELTAQVID